MKYTTLLLLLATCAWAQERTVSGQVTDSQDGSSLPGVNVILKGTANGTVTDIDGHYRLNVPAEGGTFVFSFVGMETFEAAIGERSVVDVQLGSDVKQLTEVVVTALGISREKRSLGYSTQKIGGDAVNSVKTANYVNSLSGKVSGVQIKRNNNFGGSTNVLIRGNSSLTGNNQALFVIDGVPISNSIANNRSQEQAGTGYDYGNLSADINPDDIESINILKGAAASALYGARAANGVVMITTKKGTSSKGIGVALNSSVTVGTIDRSTFPKYQNRYGAGYGPYYGSDDGFFNRADINGDGQLDDVALLTEDASYGGRFNPSRLVYQWDAFYPESPNYNKATPWVDAGENGPLSFFETPIKLSNSVSLSKVFEGGSFRLGYTNFDQKGLMPNSHLKRNNISLNSSYKLSSRLTATAFANYIKTEAVGRNSTGYSDNIMTMFRQWWQTNVDVQDLKKAYEMTSRNVTWNPLSETNPVPIYWDNPYWARYKNYQNDTRDRFLGIVSLDYKLTDWLHIFGRASVDTYTEIQEERRAVGSVANDFGLGSGADRSTGRTSAGSGYQKTTTSFTETNYALMLNFDKDITEKLNLKGVVGMNIRRTYFRSNMAATNAGLNVPDLYAIQNTVSSLVYPYEREERVGVDGVYASASLGYDNFVFLDGTIRRDQSSTLPVGKNDYYYPSVSASFVFSRFIPVDAIHFGKFRVNYATVGNSAPFDRVSDSYALNFAFNGVSSSVKGTRRNPDLKPEKTTSFEIGLEMDFLDERLGFDMSLYQNTTSNQILPLTLTRATGYSFALVNAGEIENKGVEISAFGVPLKNESGFSWRIGLNWTKNVNKVVKLYEDESGNAISNYQLGSYQGGVTVNATEGQPYGAIQGTDYLYTEQGDRIIDASSGQYIKTNVSDKVIGNVNPDWNGGITNTFAYKNLSLSFLIDIQLGGSIFSLDQYYGLATGLYAETDFTNDLGNPVRNSLADGGGVINPGVNINNIGDLEDKERSGETPVAQSKVASGNEARIRTDRFGAWGYRRGLPNSAFVYDASYVKLRELTLSYSLPRKLLENTFLNQVSFSFVGSNLWIIHKNLPHADPESGLGAGNLQGYSAGPLPTTRNFAFNVKVQF